MALRITESVEGYRRTYGAWGSEPGLPMGMFHLRHNSVVLRCIAYNGESDGWEHVSVSIPGINRTPTWGEMCFVKNAFWPEEDAVVQYHPAKEDYVNMHPFCLHLFRPVDGKFPKPDSLTVGIK